MNFNIRALLVLMRISNLPTVWSNIFGGWTLGVCLTSFEIRDNQKLLGLIFNFDLLLLLIGASCVYAAGMILNDIFDLGWDREHRSERPLPAGRFPISTARIIAAGLLIAGAALIILGSAPEARTYVGAQVMALIGLIFVYNCWHKGVVWAPYVMGLCRFMLPLIGFFAVATSATVLSSTCQILYTYALSLWAMTVSITLLARHETSPARLTSCKDYFLLLVPVPLLTVLPWNGLILISAVGYWLWVLFSNRRHALPAGIIGRVEDRLAAFPFIDAMVAGLTLGIFSPVVAISLHAFMLGCFVLILIGRRFIPVT